MKKINLIILFASSMLLVGCGKSNIPSSNTNQPTPSSEITDPTTQGSETTDTESVIPAFVGVKTVDEDGKEVVLEPIDGSYVIENNVDDQEYHVYGEIKDAIVFSESSTLSAKLCLHNASIINDEVSPVQWLAESKKIKINAVEGENSIVCNASDLDVVSSKNNVDIQGAAKLLISGSGTAVKGSAISVEGTGIFDIKSTGKNGLSGKEIILGDDEIGTDAELNHAFKLSIEAKDKALKAEFNSKGKKGTLLVNNKGEVTLKNATMGIYTEGVASLMSGNIKIVNCATSYSFASLDPAGVSDVSDIITVQ